VFTVLVDENSHYQDEDARYEHGTFETYDDAVAACQRIVDDFLAAEHRPGMSDGDLYHLYTTFGEDPFISPEPSGFRFSAWEYARLRCALLCAARQAPPGASPA
jgi:hypothetical protein